MLRYHARNNESFLKEFVFIKGYSEYAIEKILNYLHVFPKSAGSLVRENLKENTSEIFPIRWIGKRKKESNRRNP